MLDSSKSIAYTGTKNSTLRNTFLLLGLSVGVTAAVVYFLMHNVRVLATVYNFFPLGFIFLLVVPTLVERYKESTTGIVLMMVLSALVGCIISVIIVPLMKTTYGLEVVFNALLATGTTFIGLTLYAITSKEDFSYLRGGLFVFSFALLSMILLSFIFNSSVFSLFISGAIAVFAALSMLYHVSSVVNGGERNYISAALGIYLSLYNLFISLIRIFSDRR